MFHDKDLVAAVESEKCIVLVVAWLGCDPALNEMFLRALGFESLSLLSFSLNILFMFFLVLLQISLTK